MKKLRVIVVGFNPLTRKGLQVVRELDCCELVGLITMPPEAARGKSNYDPLAELAAELHENTLYIGDINGTRAQEWIRIRNSDIILQLGWSQIFTSETLKLPRMFCVGIHPAPLPVGRGAAVLNWKIIEGGGSWGNSLFIMEPTTDTGDILDFEPFAIEKRDDIYTAFCKVDRTAAMMLRRTLPRLADGTFTAIKQDNSKATRYRKRTPDDGRLDVNWNAEKICRYIHALTHPYPGAFFSMKLGCFLVWQAEKWKADEVDNMMPGSLVSIQHGSGIVIQIGENDSILLKLVTPPGDFECWADEWASEMGLKMGQKLFD